MGITGATVSFQDEILDWLNPTVLKVQKLDSGVLPPAELVRKVEATEGKQVAMIWGGIDTESASRIFSPRRRANAVANCAMSTRTPATTRATSLAWAFST